MRSETYFREMPVAHSRAPFAASPASCVPDDRPSSRFDQKSGHTVGNTTECEKLAGQLGLRRMTGPIQPARGMCVDHRQPLVIVGCPMMPPGILIGAAGDGRFETALAAVGSFNVKAVPLPTLLSTRMRP